MSQCGGGNISSAAVMRKRPFDLSPARFQASTAHWRLELISMLISAGTSLSSSSTPYLSQSALSMHRMYSTCDQSSAVAFQVS